MEAHLQLRTEAAMKAAWERAAASDERTVSDWARRTLNDAAGYREEGMRSEPVPQTPGRKQGSGPGRKPRSNAAGCTRASTHRKGVFCKACGRTP